jgi:hypothetical protein
MEKKIEERAAELHLYANIRDEKFCRNANKQSCVGSTQSTFSLFPFRK